MVVGLTYLIASLTLALITLYVRSSNDEAAGDPDTFRYGRRWGKVMLIVAALPVTVSAVIFALSHASLSDWRIIPCAAVPLFISGYLIYGYRYVKDFYIRATDVGLSIKAVWTTKHIRYESIRKVVLLHGGRGEDVLVLYGDKDKQLLRLSDSLDNLHGLCGLVRMRAGKFGADYRQRDMWGKWS
jgi:hypothetical protein